MEYAQLNEAGTDALQITSHGPIEWDAQNYCTAAALVKDGKAEQFRVVPLAVVGQPAYDPLTQAVTRDGCEKVDGEWRYKWRVDALTAEQIAANLVTLKATKAIAIKAERDRRKFNGVFVSGKWFHGDTDSRIQQIGLLMMGANIPAGLQWKTLDGSFVVMTPTLAAQIFNAAAAQDQAIFSKAEEHRVAMEASADPAVYDFSGGWPAAYVE